MQRTMRTRRELSHTKDSLRLFLPVLLCVAAAIPVYSQLMEPGFPEGAVILERRNLPVGNQLNRALVLWMLNPKKHP